MLTITVLRMLDALSGTQGLVIWTVGVVAGSALAIGSALLLRTQPNFVYLVDGGVCDNLGPASAYLTRDDRYAGLGELLYGPTRPDDGPETLLIVVDASKSVDTNYFARTLSPLAARSRCGSGSSCGRASSSSRTPTPARGGARCRS